MVDKLFPGKEVKLDPKRCQYILASGLQCGQYPGEGRKLCMFHDPERADEAKAAQRLGGLQGGKRKYIAGTRIPLEGLDDILENLGEVLHNLQGCTFTPAVANSMIRALQVAQACYLERWERDEINAQIEALEKAIEEHKQTT